MANGPAVGRSTRCATRPMVRRSPKSNAPERSQRLKRWSELMLSNQKDLAHLLSLEQGKPLAEAMGEVVYAASFLEWFAEEAKRAYGDVIPSHKADARIILLMRQAADTLKKVSLELGGNAPFIVFDDADLDAAVKGAMASKFRNAGQTCVCVNRFFIQDGVYDAFTRKLAEAVSAMRVGSALDGETEQGPLINAAALAKVEAHVGDALEKGAKLLCGGRRHALGGTFFEPTILTEAHGEMLIAQEETFGPVAACFRFKDEAEVLQRANDTPFGLSAYFYSRDIGRVWRMAEGLEAGMVGINEGIISTEVAPFGGIKESGLGREGSRYGLEDYLEIKYLLMGGL
eukprot:gene2300-2609_t